MGRVSTMPVLALLTDDDLLLGVDDPDGTPSSAGVPVSVLKAHIGGGAVVDTAGGEQKLSIGTEAPSSPAVDDLWYDTDAPALEASNSTVDTAEETTTTRTLELSDAGKIVECTHADPTTVTVPPNSSVPFPMGTVLAVYAAGAGGVTIAEGAGVTIRNLAAITQYEETSLRKRATDEWVQV